MFAGGPGGRNFATSLYHKCPFCQGGSNVREAPARASSGPIGVRIVALYDVQARTVGIGVPPDALRNHYSMATSGLRPWTRRQSFRQKNPGNSMVVSRCVLVQN